MQLLERLFHLRERGTTLRTECLAGLTSFMSMCYVLFVIPAMLADAGMPAAETGTALVWVTVGATLVMGLWAGFPVAVAPGLGISAFFAY